MKEALSKTLMHYFIRLCYLSSRYLSKVVPIGDQELNEIDQIISGSEIFLTRKRGSATPSMNTSAYHIK